MLSAPHCWGLKTHIYLCSKHYLNPSQCSMGLRVFYRIFLNIFHIQIKRELVFWRTKRKHGPREALVPRLNLPQITLNWSLCSWTMEPPPPQHIWSTPKRPNKKCSWWSKTSNRGCELCCKRWHYDNLFTLLNFKFEVDFCSVGPSTLWYPKSSLHMSSHM